MTAAVIGPDSGTIITGPRGKHPGLGIGSHADHRVLVAIQDDMHDSVVGLQVARVPKQNGSVLAAADNVIAVGEKGHGEDKVVVAGIRTFTKGTDAPCYPKFPQSQFLVQ